MKPYAPRNNKGRTVAVDDIHHRTADQPKAGAVAAAKAMRHAARQHGGKEVGAELDALQEVDNGSGSSSTQP